LCFFHSRECCFGEENFTFFIVSKASCRVRAKQYCGKNINEKFYSLTMSFNLRNIFPSTKKIQQTAVEKLKFFEKNPASNSQTFPPVVW
jgi:hypothetical protein